MTPTIERRRSGRRRACFGGTLRIAAFLPEVECRLRDHSLTGARIVVDAAVILPRVLDLTVTCRDRTCRAEVVWRKGTQAGLAFRDGPTPELGMHAKTAEATKAWAAAILPGRLH